MFKSRADASAPLTDRYIEKKIQYTSRIESSCRTQEERTHLKKMSGIQVFSRICVKSSKF